MNRLLLVGLTWVATSTVLVAEETIKLDGLDTKPYQDLFQVPEDQAQPNAPAATASDALTPPMHGEISKGDRCMEMARQVEALKGKPLQRSALNERYQHECGLD